jgi:hypothetical protein
MRCPKCGYFSFDHLDRCVKCQGDLTGERDQLNLPGIKPTPISLKEILDREAYLSRKKNTREREESPIRPTKPDVPTGPELFLEEGISLDPDWKAKGTKKPKQEDGEIELSLEGLELTLVPKKDY